MFTLAVATALLFPQTKPVLVPPGSLISTGETPIVLPLKSTNVNAEIEGFGARVTIVQTFTNPTNAPIEAVYTFPMTADAAVDRMRMKIGDRIIDGIIKPREEARAIYDAAKSQGKAAALLDQERPNIFTQSVANILPNAQVQIEISYVQLVKYEDGQFEFSFPMVVGPRFLGNAPDPGKIAPPTLAPGVRSGANIALHINLNAGAPVTGIKSVLHEISVTPRNSSQAIIELKRKDEIPNKDFILRYRVATNSVQSAFLSQFDSTKGGFFSLVLLPPKAPTQQQIAPKEVIFVMDQSGSQNGFPIEKSKELTLKLIKTLNPGDTFNVMGFANGVNLLWQEPHGVSEAAVDEASAFVRGLSANGGTQLRAAVEAALTPAPDPKRIRLVVFNTDGFVGDEPAILQSIRKYRGNTRMFTFGIGNGVNRYLIDSMSEEGRGDSETVTLAEKADEAVQRFIDRTQNPILTNVSVSVDGLPVSDVLPAALPDVFSEKPIVVYGRYATPGKGTVTIRGTMAGKPWSQTLNVTFPGAAHNNGPISTLWARRQVDHIERHYMMLERGQDSQAQSKTAITDLAMEFGIMTQYTSFVAVEQRVINVGGKQRTVHVPVEMTDGVSMEFNNPTVVPASPMMSQGLFRGGAAGGPGGSGGFGGGGVGGGGSAGFAKSLDKDTGVAYLSYDPTDNSFILDEKALAKLPPEEQKKIRAQQEKMTFESKVAKSLRNKKGMLELQLWMTDLSDEAVAELKKLGFAVDAKAKDLKVVFGRCDAAKLHALAMNKYVKRVEPIS